MATGEDLELFAARWGLDEAAVASLLQLGQELRAKVVADFAPKPGTRDVNRLFHGFLKSVRTTAAQAQPLAAEGSDTVVLPDGALSSAEEKTTGWHVQTDTIDVEAFLTRWGLDEAAHAMIVEQMPEVQARVMTEFAPKPGTRDVNRLLHGFIRSVRNATSPLPTAGHAAAAAAAAAAEEPREQEYEEPTQQEYEEVLYAYGTEAAATQEEESYLIDEGIYRYATDDSMAQQDDEEYFTTLPAYAPLAGSRALPRSSPAAAPAAQPSVTPRLVDIPSFAAHWGLDAAAQAALQQLAPEVQTKVLTDFAPKPGTRDVNRLFHGFIRSVQTTAPPGQQSVPSNRYVSTHAYAAEAAAPAPAPSPATAPQPVAAGQTERLQAFVDHWGLDAGSVAALVQLSSDMQTRVVTEFSPKPHTQDINRLFRGFIKSVQTSGGQRHPRVYTIMKQDVLQAEAPAYGNGAQYAAYTGGAAAESFAEETAAFQVPQGYSVEGGKRDYDLAEESPAHEELDNFIRTWNLGEECLVTLEGQPADIQRKVLDQFHPKVGTRDVRSLFFGFLRSLAGGGAKRHRTA